MVMVLEAPEKVIVPELPSPIVRDSFKIKLLGWVFEVMVTA